MEKNRFLNQTINWKQVQDEINKRLDSKYNRDYIMHIYHGVFKSARIKEILDEILPPYRKMKKAA